MFFVVYVYFPCLVFGLHSFDYCYNFGSLDYSFNLMVISKSVKIHELQLKTWEYQRVWKGEICGKKRFVYWQEKHKITKYLVQAHKERARDHYRWDNEFKPYIYILYKCTKNKKK